MQLSNNRDVGETRSIGPAVRFRKWTVVVFQRGQFAFVLRQVIRRKKAHLIEEAWGRQEEKVDDTEWQDQHSVSDL